MLEQRENPANLVWTDAIGNHDFNTAGNWKDKLTGLPAAAAPGPNDVPWFDGVNGTNNGVTFPIPAQPGGENPPPPQPPSYAGIVIENGYTGTVVFPVSVNFGGYTQTCGTVNQQGVNNTVTVTSAFSWTGGDIGTFGSGTYLLKGIGIGSGQIGTDTSTLHCGSRFELEKQGATETWVKQAGVVHLLADITGFVVNTDCYLMQMRSNPNGPGVLPKIEIDPSESGDRGVTLHGGRFMSESGTVLSVRIIDDPDTDPAVEEGGRLSVFGTGLTVTGRTPYSPWGVTMLVNGSIRVNNGATLKATHGVYMNVGTFKGIYEGGPVQSATIDGVFQMNGGLLDLGENSLLVTVYYKLIVTQPPKLHGGTFSPKLDPANAANADNIQSSDKLDTRDTFQITPLNVAPVAFAEILTSVNGFTALSVDPHNPDPNSYTMGRSANGKNFEVKR